MGLEYKIKIAVFKNGERFPLLLDGNGVPHWHSTLFVTTMVRNASKAPNTMRALLEAVRILLSWASINNTDLEARFVQRRFLVDSEIESLRGYSERRTDESEGIERKLTVSVLRRREKGRANILDPECRVSGGTHYIRLTYIAEYLEWYAMRVIEREAKVVDSETSRRIKAMSLGLRLRRPNKARSSRLTARKGLSHEAQEELIEMVKPGSKNNPFDSTIQLRNYLIILLLHSLGLRAGELLSLKVSDFDFQKNELVIARRHGDKSDPRANQPVAKTLDRRVPLSSLIVKKVSDYVLGPRRQMPQAKRHEFLFVTHKSGAYMGQPLSMKGLAKLFSVIQRVGSEELRGVSPHVLRHTANDRFSELMEKGKIKPAEEEKMRSYLMGWKEGSGTAATYTRRYVENKAKEAFLKLQDSSRTDKD